MQPIEYRSFGWCWIRSKKSAERLQEADDCCHRSDNCMRIVFGRPATDLDEDQNECGNGEQPREHHEHTMPGEPLIFAAQLAADPRLFEIPCEQNAHRCGSDPGRQHERSMQTNEEHGAARHNGHFGQVGGTGRCQTADVVVADAILCKLKNQKYSSVTKHAC